MKFTNLKISNFGSIKEAEIPLANQGLVLVLGRNEDAVRADSNGSGKSMLLDALTWALWGSTVRGLTSDEVINNQIQCNCSVAIDFEDAGNSYQIVRYRKNKTDKNWKPNDLVLFHNGEDVSGPSISATQDMINSLVGIDFITFSAMMPGAGVNVATLTDSEIKKLLERLLNTEALRKAHDRANLELKKLSTELAILSTQIDALRAYRIKCQEKYDEVSRKESEYYLDKVMSLDELGKQIDDVKFRLDQYEAESAKAPQLRERQNSLKFSLSKKKRTFENIKVDYNKTDAHYTEQVNNLKTKLAVAEADKKAIEETLKRVSSLEGECPSCFQICDDEHQDNLIQEWSEKLREIVLGIELIEASLTTTKAQKKKELEGMYATLQTENEERAEIEKELAELDNSLRNIESIEKDIEYNEKELDSLTQQISELENTENPYAEIRKLEQASLDETVEKILEITEQEKDLANRNDLVKFWVDSFSATGLRSLMLEHITPLLNHFAAEYSKILTNNEMTVTFHTSTILKSGKTVEKFYIKVDQKHGGDSYVSTSAGERARANLIIALALGDLAALRASKTIPFRFLDEPFESVDSSGIESIVSLLNMQREKYDTVYVITHNNDFQQLFPRSITMVKKDGFSRLEGTNEGTL